MSKKNKLEVLAECDSCNGTGLYVGMGERAGAAVVCSTCEGTGCHERVFEWRDFKERKRKYNVRRVFRTGCGICIGEGKTDEGKVLKLEDFGGISYNEWFENEDSKKFPKGSEMRNYTCPAWWFQNTDYDKKPSWDECICIGSFSSCKHFKTKAKCWERYDKYGKKGS